MCSVKSGGPGLLLAELQLDSDLLFPAAAAGFSQSDHSGLRGSDDRWPQHRSEPSRGGELEALPEVQAALQQRLMSPTVAETACGALRRLCCSSKERHTEAGRLADLKAAPHQHLPGSAAVAEAACGALSGQVHLQ
eukprot:jgi/Tetstr1/424648/TSEL_015170.t1